MWPPKRRTSARGVRDAWRPLDARSTLIDTRLVRAELARLRAPRPATDNPRRAHHPLDARRRGRAWRRHVLPGARPTPRDAATSSRCWPTRGGLPLRDGAAHRRLRLRPVLRRRVAEERARVQPDRRRDDRRADRRRQEKLGPSCAAVVPVRGRAGTVRDQRRARLELRTPVRARDDVPVDRRPLPPRVLSIPRRPACCCWSTNATRAATAPA